MFTSGSGPERRAQLKSIMRGLKANDTREKTAKRLEQMTQKKRSGIHEDWATLEEPNNSTLVDSFAMTMKCYLGNSETIRSHEEMLVKKRDYYTSIRIPNFYAIVMPGGHGKTRMCREYGFVDVDSLVSEQDGEELFRMRADLVYCNSNDWRKHNYKWYEMMKDTISMMTFETPVLMLVHSEECALELGATPLAALALSSYQFEQNVLNRTRLAKVFSIISREFVMTRCSGRVEVYPTNGDLEARILDLCNYYDIPVACPYKYARTHRNRWYHPNTPRWIVEGKIRGREACLDELLTLAEREWVPKEAVDHFLKHTTSVGRAYGYGVSLDDWAKVFAKVAGGVRKPEYFDKKGDMFEIFPPASEAEKHRVNITLRRMMEGLDIWSDEDVKIIGQRHVGERHVFVTSLVCHWMGVGSKLPIADSIYAFYLVRFERWSKVMSEVHSLIRLSNWFFTTPVSEETKQSVMYMNMLSGRQMYEADWKKVLDERETDSGTDYVSFDPVRQVWSRTQYLEDFNTALYEAYRGMFDAAANVDVENFVQFWKKRRSWVAKGSTVLNQLPKEMLKYQINFMNKANETFERMEVRHNKKSLFESNIMLDKLHETISSWNATKAVAKLNETGKQRELLPGTLMHYLVFSYVLYVAERQARVGSTRLNLNDDDNIMNYDRKMMGRQHHMLYDWANFNAQHSKSDMAKVITWLKQIPTAPGDFSYYCDAIAESFYHMYLIDESGDKHKLEKGLFSGWRGTTWINTVLNYVYVSIGIKSCKRLYGDLEINYVDHGGDDLDISFSKPADCFRLLEVMDKIGFEATAIKQMIDVKAEFYRNTINSRGVFASPTRALANFVSGNWETGGSKTISEKTTSILDQVWKLMRRGVDENFCYRLCNMALKHWLKIKCDDEWMEIRPELMHGRIEDGGLGIPDVNGELWVLKNPIKVSKASNLAFKLPGAYCTEDYVELIETRLNRMNLQLTDKRGLVQKLAKQSYDLAQFEERTLFEELNKMKAEVVGRKKVIEYHWNHELYVEFLNWVNTGGERVRTASIDELVEFLGHMSAGNKLLTKADLVWLLLKESITMEAVDFKGDVYYRRLVPDFMANLIDGFIRWYGNRTMACMSEMEFWFRTLCYMVSNVYEHRA